MFVLDIDKKYEYLLKFLTMATMTISLPDQVAQLVDKETQRKGFATRSEFIRNLLRSYFSQEFPLELFSPRPLEEIQDALIQTGTYNKKFITSVLKGLKKSSVYDH